MNCEKIAVLLLLAAVSALATAIDDLPFVPPKNCGTNMYDNSSSLNRIVGGQVSAPHYWPWQVSLQYYNQHFCGASIINEYYIISAAHCFKGNPNIAKFSKAVVGKHDLMDYEIGQATFEFDEVIDHKLYRDKVFTDDIALIRLNKPITFSDTVQPVCLPKTDVGDLVGVVASTTGWGKLGWTEGPPNELYQVELPIITNEQCQKDYDNANMVVIPSMVCAGYAVGGKGICQGDSGGPLVVKDNTTGLWTLVGISSWTRVHCADKNSPSAYSRVSEFIDWIYGAANGTYVYPTEGPVSSATQAAYSTVPILLAALSVSVIARL